MSLNITNGIVLKTKKTITPKHHESEDTFENIFLGKSNDLQESLDNLITIREALAKVKYSSEAIEVLKTDVIFKQIIESNANPKVALDSTIKQSYENLLQEFISYGPFGAIPAVLYMLNKIKYDVEYIYRHNLHKVEVPTHRFSNVNLGKQNIYLPRYDEAVKILKGLKLLKGAIESFVKSPNIKITPIVAGLRELGFNITEDMVVKNYYKIDWKAVLGGNIGAFLGLALTPILGPALAAFAGINWSKSGSIIGSKNSGFLIDKGYNPTTFKNCCKEFYDLGEATEAMKRLRLPKTIENVEGAAEKLKFIKSAIKVYLSTLKTFGRGLLSAARTVS